MGEHVGSRCGLRYYLLMPPLELELELDGLRRRYGSVTALDGLSFGIPTGQVFGFLGPNGADKPNIGQ
jgi:ABC-type sugar transport system ATPase subunit